MTKYSRYKPKGWRGEPYRHYLASKGVKTNRRYMAYQSTYTGADLPLIAADGVGTAGAAAVSLIPLAVLAGGLYVGARGIKRKSDGESFFKWKNEFPNSNAWEVVEYPEDKYAAVKMIPTEKAFEMRRKGSGIRSMEPKRTDVTMKRIEKSMRKKGFTEPIRASPKEIKEGRLQDGKHRLIVAKKLGIKEVPVDISEDFI